MIAEARRLFEMQERRSRLFRMRIASGAGLLAVVAVAGWCAETVEQHAARLAVERAAAGAGREGATRCTSNPQLFFTEGPTAKVFVCVVKSGGGLCDRYLVRRSRHDYRARLQQRDGDCILPP